MAPASHGAGELGPDELQLAFHEVECHDYDERFGIAYDRWQGRAVASEVRGLVGRRRLARVLDVGCGTGYVGLGLIAAGAVDEAWLVDLSPGMLERARANAGDLDGRARFLRASAADLPLTTGSFDAVVTRGVLHHLHDPVAALAEWRRVVRPGGPVVLLSEPSPQADRVGGAVARSALAAVARVRAVAEHLGRPLPSLPESEAEERRFWDHVAMAANLHTFTTDDLASLGRAAGFGDVSVRGVGASSIAWASAYHVLVGEFPRAGRSPVARWTASRVYGALRRLDTRVLQPLLPDRRLLTVQAVMRG